MEKMQPLKLEFLVICDFALTSREGKLSIIGKFDRIFTRNFPSQHARMFLVASFFGEDSSEHQLKFSIKDPSGKELITDKNLEVKVKVSEGGSGNIITDLVNLPLGMAGEHTVSLWENSQKLGETKFTVAQIKENEKTGNLPN